MSARGWSRSPGRGLAVGILLALLLALPAAAQDDDDEGRTLTLPGSGREVPLYVVEDEIFILEDLDWCENLIALTEEQDADGSIMPADTVRTELCAIFLERLAQNEVALLPLSLASQLVALPDELLQPMERPSFAPGDDLAAVSGSGESRSETFELSGGDYEAVVQTTVDCEFFAAFLADGETEVPITDLEASGPLRGIPASTYYWDVLASGCDGSITLASS